ncbi:MAG: aconitate hydratase AcnA [Chloroflexi bacterium HGW-Chloroflexi-4]|jgi:aconitate hydratase|nr:MAG: aconitate hydratase AcnA [Chloroflexi bacterium HGW-Chloroflexi-4]
MSHKNNPYLTDSISLEGKTYRYYPLRQIEETGTPKLQNLPYCIRIMLESSLRNFNGQTITAQNVNDLVNWTSIPGDHGLVSFNPARILLQDLTGVPLVVDLAALREAAQRNGKDPAGINPLIPVDLVIDHSIQVDFAGSGEALAKNTKIEYARNRERYEFLKWAQSSIRNFRVIPPASGIVHQVNLEYLAQVAMTNEEDGEIWVYPDSVFGTDSHTTMINGLGVLGWGVGGIEAAAAMLRQPVETLIPDVVGVKVSGSLKEGVSPTDVVLTLTHMLRKLGVVNKMVEFYGEGLDALSVPNRAMLSNMAPEYGATAAYFPVDQAVLDYLQLTGRPAELVSLVEAYFKAQGLFRSAESTVPEYTVKVDLNLDLIEPSLAGPKRPQDLVQLDQVSQNFKNALSAPLDARGFALPAELLDKKAALNLAGSPSELTHGSVVIASITSCTNTSDPFALISAGLLAKKATSLGLRAQPYVKTSFSPGSKAVMDYLQKAGLVEPLEQLGFHLVGFGCTTCIGNSGPLNSAIGEAITQNKLVAASVISGNRNFEGRVHPLVQANYLASPALVVAYALSGNMQRDLRQAPLGYSQSGEPVFLKDVWPSNQEVYNTLNQVVTPEVYRDAYAKITEGGELWKSIKVEPSLLYHWNPASTYILESPFCDTKSNAGTDLISARILAIFGDSITTDHISPAGSIPGSSPAADYLRSKGVQPADFNSYGARRGNHEVMERGTFANIRIKNLLLPGVEGSQTRHYPDGEQMSIFEAAQRYKQDGVDTIILAGKEYGTGSSRDWAAKGPLLLGVKAVIAESFERIHRSNLAGMGVLPLKFAENENAKTLGLEEAEIITLQGLSHVTPGGMISVTAYKNDGVTVRFLVKVLLNSEVEIKLWQNGGILKSFVK